MPFINDVINANKSTIEEQAIKKNNPSRFVFDPEKIVAHLKANLIGQNDAIESIGDTLFRIKAEINEDNKPLGVVFLVGPTGVGKTELVNLLAKSLPGNSNNLCRIDMNTLSQSHYSASLSGAPPGYSGSKENQTLYDNEIIEGTYSKPGVVLFDEIEKASTEVIRSLLNVLDNGRLSLTSGTKNINFCNSLIFFTSNLGSSDLLRKSRFNWRNVNQKHEKAFKSLEGYFDAEFLNRIEQFVFFDPLERDSINQLIDLEERKLNERLRRCSATFYFDEIARTELQSAYQRNYGARNIRHRIRRDIEPLIARCIVDGSIADSRYRITHSKAKFRIQKA